VLGCGTTAQSTNTTGALATTPSTQPPTATTVAEPSSASATDRHDPESVLRAYFAAWERGDWAGQKSFMDAQYANLVPEPVQSISIVSLQLAEKSSSHCLYRVSFDIAVEGNGVSMMNGRYDWSYDLNWDAQRQSWIITNYGEG
jgi:hypothetical protein